MSHAVLNNPSSTDMPECFVKRVATIGILPPFQTASVLTWNAEAEINKLV